jgi:hypothetical protein
LKHLLICNAYCLDTLNTNTNTLKRLPNFPNLISNLWSRVSLNWFPSHNFWRSYLASIRVRLRSHYCLFDFNLMCKTYFNQLHSVHLSNSSISHIFFLVYYWVYSTYNTWFFVETYLDVFRSNTALFWWSTKMICRGF